MIELTLKKMLMERVTLMGSLLNSTKVIIGVVVSFIAKVRTSYQKTKYQPSTDIENIQTLGKVVDILDICNFYRGLILPICWR
jgi:hypothetical protein